MRDAECVQFLQWAVPRMRMKWSGFRKVRRQVCRRIRTRMAQLRLDGYQAYRVYLEGHPDEWQTLDRLCCVTISRFYRDKGVYDALRSTVLPELAERALSVDRRRILVWSAGCGSGEEPYTVALLWELAVKGSFPGCDIGVLASDSNPDLLRRAARACYPGSVLRELPVQWKSVAFESEDSGCCRLLPEFREKVHLVAHDLRAFAPGGRFDLVLCRNMAFTYWEDELQVETARRLGQVLRPGGYLVVGAHEALPNGVDGFKAVDGAKCMWRWQ